MKLRNLVVAGVASALFTSTAPAAVVNFDYAAYTTDFIFGIGSTGQGSFETAGSDGTYTLADGLSNFSLNGSHFAFFSYGSVGMGKGDLASFSATLSGGKLTDLNFVTKTVAAPVKSFFDIFLPFQEQRTADVKYSVSGLKPDNLTFQLDEGTITGTLNANVVVAAVPEPATWAMMLGGFGLVGAAMRRRRAHVTTAVRFA
ncbi:PEPxxWA-CTERM sorting domain-containing protein [Sphingomonas profundi]|uniref:PEPxxWA-CTERM sorting domain-containing protein n=1 Tax=Alterirhizorhabdus profundi TaxID=2681549 RepID=UPI001E395D5B|nr:PEPxxWA-CTERM sorting domain-containing protein [Sphingomonas profundi]